MIRRPLLVLFLLAASTLPSCDIWSTDEAIAYQPAQVAVGPFTLGVWLPAGLSQHRFDEADRQNLLALGINQLEWLQRAADGEPSPEAAAMDFSNANGLHMPVYYEPPGTSPYDKLHNWATRTQMDATFADSLRLLVQRLKARWEDQTAFQGYLVGHEDYKADFYPALASTIDVLRQEDPLRPAYTVGNLTDYRALDNFLDAFFQPGGPSNVFQHEHYVFRAGVPFQGRPLQKQLDALINSYDQVAHHLHGRNGRWHGIIQVHEEERSRLFLRAPTPAEIRLQAGLALTRGASGIIYFLYSSGLEEVRNGQGELVERRVYTGLVDDNNQPNKRYTAVQQLNKTLKEYSAKMETLYYYGAFSSRNRRQNPVVNHASGDLEFGLFGDRTQITHMLVVNRRPTENRTVTLRLNALALTDALTGLAVEIRMGETELDLEPGGLRLLVLEGLPTLLTD